MGKMIMIPPPKHSIGFALGNFERKPSPETLRRQHMRAVLEQSVVNAKNRQARVQNALRILDEEAQINTAPAAPASKLKSIWNEQKHLETAEHHCAGENTRKSYSHLFAASGCEAVTNIFAMSAAAALNSLLHHLNSTQSKQTHSIIDCEGPPLHTSLKVVAPTASIPSQAANVLEIYVILSSAVLRTYMPASSVLEVLMLLDRAVTAGLTITLSCTRRFIIAALSIAHRRSKLDAAAAAVTFSEPLSNTATNFARMCFPSLSLHRLETAELRLSQVLDHDMRFLDDAELRADYAARLAWSADKNQQIFQDYMRNINDLRTLSR